MRCANGIYNMNKEEFQRGYTVRKGMVFFQIRILVPEVQELKREIFHAYHEIPMAGHGGLQKTHRAIVDIFFWKNMRKEIQEMLRECQVCQKVKYIIDKKQGLLQPLPVPERPWSEVTLDFIVSLPSSKGFVAVLVVVDRFTKGAHFCPFKPSFTASQVAHVFIQHVVKLHGFPRSVITNQDQLFLSKF